MELSERIIATLESQGYTSIDEQQHAPDASPGPVSSDFSTTIHVTDGIVTVTHGGNAVVLHLGEQVTIPAHIP